MGDGLSLTAKRKLDESDTWVVDRSEDFLCVIVDYILDSMWVSLILNKSLLVFSVQIFIKLIMHEFLTVSFYKRVSV